MKKAYLYHKCYIDILRLNVIKLLHGRNHNIFVRINGILSDSEWNDTILNLNVEYNLDIPLTHENFILIYTNDDTTWKCELDYEKIKNILDPDYKEE